MLELLLISICLLINAVLSCIEMAFVAVSKPQIKQMMKTQPKAAAHLLILKNTPERVLSVLQVGITLVGAVSAAVGGAGAEEVLSPYLMTRLGISEENAELLSIAIVVIPLTYISVVIGELVPKTLALRFPMRFALMGGYVLVILDRIFSPFVYLLEVSTKFVTQFVFARLKPEKMVDPSREVDLDPLSESHKQYVFNLIDVNKKSVKDVMITWDQVATVDYSEHFYHVLEKIRICRHTRLPVLNEGKIVGILHTKEFVSETEVSKIDWTELIRSAVTIGPRESILNALRIIQQKKSHMAIVMNGEEALGIITMEDIFEEVVGDIADEVEDPRTLLSTSSKLRRMKR